jgi:hypothetical protein
MSESKSRTSPRRRTLLLAGAGTLAVPMLASGVAGCGTFREPGPVVDLPPPRVQVGDRWVYREINRYNGLPLADVEVTVTAVAPLTCNVRRKRSDTTAGEIARPDAVLVERYAQPWMVDLEPTYDMTIDFAEPMPIVPPSARIGETQTSRTRYTVSGYYGSYGWMQRLTVAGTGRIATPAGNFDCIEVERRVWFDYPDVFRFNSSRIDRVWYAPQVNRWVRREWTGEYLHENSLDEFGGIRRREDWVSWELLSYTPAAGATG